MVMRGAEITESDWDAFFAFYMDTADRKWGSPYLNREFFACLGETLADEYGEREDTHPDAALVAELERSLDYEIDDAEMAGAA